MRRISKMQSSVFLALVSLSLSALPGPSSGPEVPEKIVNGLATTDFPSVVALVEGPYTTCSGTLIGCETVLTAAHCVCTSTGASCQAGGGDLADPASIRVFAQHGGLFTVSSIAVPPSYVFGSAADVAVLKLATPVSGIAPTPINTHSSPGSGLSGTITGFGKTGGDNVDFGVKRTGQIVTAACGAPEATHVCWEYEAPVGPPGDDSNTCNGDSGGPLFLDLGAGVTVAGVTSGGVNANCLTPDSSFDTDVYVDRAWIQAQGSADLANKRCGNLAQAGEAGALYASMTGSLDAMTAEHAETFTVPAETSVLRVVLNGNDEADFDLYVRFGSPATTLDYDCASLSSAVFEACEIAMPAAGTWHVLVRRALGAGEFQLVATPFSDSGEIFSDGFESGDATQWSGQVP